MRNLLRDFIPAFDQIEELKKQRQVQLLCRGTLNGKAATLRKSKVGFQLQIDGFVSGAIDTDKNYQFSISAAPELRIRNAYCTSVKTRFLRRVSQSHLFEISAMEHRLNHKQKYYGRKIISIDTDSPFFCMIDHLSYSHPLGSSRGMILVSLQVENDYTTYRYTNKGNHYLLIDSEIKKRSEDFNEECWSILVSLGYLLGYLPQDEEYTFYYPSKATGKFSAFEYQITRNTIKTIYKPVHSNPHAWRLPVRQARKYSKILRNVSSNEFSTLCQWVQAEDDIKAILLLILEATQNSLMLRPAGLSVALEGLTEYFNEKNAAVLKPIADKKTSRKLIKELKDVLSTYEEHAAVQNFSTLVAKIEQINAPTNAEKLRAPFKILDIPLSETDREVIEYRNDFLHGNINLNPHKGKKTYQMSTFEITLRLLTLLNAIIMKKIGFNNLILNHVKLQEVRSMKNITEPYYRQLSLGTVVRSQPKVIAKPEELE